MILIVGVVCLLIVSCKKVSKDTASVVKDSAAATPQQVLPEEAPVVNEAEPESDTVSEKKNESAAATAPDIKIDSKKSSRKTVI